MSASAVRPRSRVVAPPKPTPTPAPSEAAITRMLAQPAPAAHPGEASPALIAMLAEWNALLERINSRGISDAEVERLAPRHDALQMAIYAYPAASVADLVAKVPVFEDELRDAVSGLNEDFQPQDTLTGAAWLGLFRDFKRLARQTAADTTLPVQAVDLIHALIAEHRTAYSEWDRLSSAWAQLEPSAPGYAEAYARGRADCDGPGRRESALLEALVTAKPTTLAGIAALADYLPGALRQVDPNAQEPDSEVALRNIAAALRGLGARPVTEPSLVDQIVACWRDWSLCSDGTEEGEAAANPVRLGERRLALIAAADALPATPENLPAKALALAWVEYVSLWRMEQPREAYAIDGRLALDADAAICGRLYTGA